jgi:hypothetical protein
MKNIILPTISLSTMAHSVTPPAPTRLAASFTSFVLVASARVVPEFERVSG